MLDISNHGHEKCKTLSSQKAHQNFHTLPVHLFNRPVEKGYLDSVFKLFFLLPIGYDKGKKKKKKHKMILLWSSWQNCLIHFAFCISPIFSLLSISGAESPSRFFDWRITYGDIYPLGIRQQVLLISCMHASMQRF